MFPLEIICEIMSHLTYHDIKHMALANRMCSAATKQTNIRKLVRTGKISQTRSYEYHCNHAIFRMTVDIYVDKIHKHEHVDHYQILMDLSFITDVFKNSFVVLPVPNFDTVLEKALSLKQQNPVFDSFLKICSTIYETALESNDVQVQIAVLKLFQGVIQHIEFFGYAKIFRELSERNGSLFIPTI